MGIYIQETWVDKTGNYIIGENEPYETYHDTIGDLFKSLQQEYGRCKSRMYVDKKSGDTKQVGWVFEKRDKYTDVNETYLKETWVYVYEGQPELVTRHFVGESYGF